MLHPDYPAWSALGMIMMVMPLPWHWRARNIATLGLIFWIFIDNLFVFINTLIWADNFRNHAPIWCDISGRGLYIIPYAVSTCSALQMRRLESVASTRRSVVSASERTRRLWLEGCLGFGIPLIMLPPLWVFQGHRYDIVESLGPSIPLYTTWPAILFRYFVPLALSLTSITYAALAIRWFVVRRMQFRAILAASNSGLNLSRYLRLIALAVVLNVVVLANDLVGAIWTLKYRIVPNASFHYIHVGYGIISYYPEAVQNPTFYSINVLQVYVGPLYAVIFFIFFGLSEEAIGEYVKIMGKARNGLSRVGALSTKPVWAPAPPALNLGSRAIPTASLPWRATDRRTQSNEDQDERMFGGDLVPPTDSHPGIPILVERSIV